MEDRFATEGLRLLSSYEMPHSNLSRRYRNVWAVLRNFTP